MRTYALVLGAALLWPVIGCTQALSGDYRYEGPNGVAALTLRQESAARVTGTLQMANGSTFTIEAQVENGRALGDIVFDGDKGFFAAGFQGSTLLVVVAERDPSNGQPKLDAGWSLEFARVGTDSGKTAAGSDGALGPGAAAMLGQAPAAPAAATAPRAAPPASGGAFAQTDQSPTALAWIEKLRGKKVSYLSSYSSGSSGGYSDRWEAYLCSDGRFVYRSSSMMAVDNGAFGHSASRGGMNGVWRIVTQGNQAAIEYRSDDGQTEHVMLGFQDGKTYWDGQRVFVTGDNNVCG